MKIKKMFVIIIIAIFSLTLTSSVVKTYSQNMALDLDQSLSIEAHGGNLYIFYDVDILNVVSNPPQFIEFSYPRDMFKKAVYIFVEGRVKNESKLDTKIVFSGETVKIRVDTSRLEVVNKKSNFQLVIFIPLHVFQKVLTDYLFKIVEYPASNIPINHTKLTINMPVNTRPEDYPDLLTLIQMSPAEGGGEQYKLEGDFIRNEIVYSSTGLPEIFTVKLSNRDQANPAILLLEGEEAIELTVYPDGTLKSKYVYSLTNLGKETIDKETRIAILKSSNELNVEVQTLLNRSISFDERDGRIFVNSPYVVDENNTLQLKALFEEKNRIINVGILGDKISYKIDLKPTVNYFIKQATVKVLRPDGKVIETHTFYNFTRFSSIILNNSVDLNLFSIIYSNIPIGLTALTFIMMGLGITSYKIYHDLLISKIPEELKEYLDELKKETMLMEKLIRLEDRYLNREIKSKDYLSQRSKLIKKLNQLIKVNERTKNRVYKDFKENKRVIDTINIINNMEDKWRELRKIEGEYLNRKIKPDEYMDQRKKILVEFKTLIKEIGAVI